MYKAFALAALLAFVGCREQTETHTNVVIDITKTDTKGWILMRDIETGKERLYVRHLKEKAVSRDFESLQRGDTIVIGWTTDWANRKFCTPYEKRKIIYGHYGDIKNIDMYSLKELEKFKNELEEMKVAQQHELSK